MINQISITNKQIEKAKNLSEELGKLKNSITDGGHNIYGFLGELIVAEYLNTEQKNTYDYDMKLPSGLTIDVKTKRCTSTPSPNYECSIAAYNTKQKCDVYVFTRILDNMKVGWILGYKTK